LLTRIVRGGLSPPRVSRAGGYPSCQTQPWLREAASHAEASQKLPLVPHNMVFKSPGPTPKGVGHWHSKCLRKFLAFLHVMNARESAPKSCSTSRRADSQALSDRVGVVPPKAVRAVVGTEGIGSRARRQDVRRTGPRPRRSEKVPILAARQGADRVRSLRRRGTASNHWLT
jgi:hypothetical protein